MAPVIINDGGRNLDNIVRQAELLLVEGEESRCLEDGTVADILSADEGQPGEQLLQRVGGVELVAGKASDGKSWLAGHLTVELRLTLKLLHNLGVVAAHEKEVKVDPTQLLDIC